MLCYLQYVKLQKILNYNKLFNKKNKIPFCVNKFWSIIKISTCPIVEICKYSINCFLKIFSFLPGLKKWFWSRIIFIFLQLLSLSVYIFLLSVSFKGVITPSPPCIDNMEHFNFIEILLIWIFLYTHVNCVNW